MARRACPTSITLACLVPSLLCLICGRPCARMCLCLQIYTKIRQVCSMLRIFDGDSSYVYMQPLQFHDSGYAHSTPQFVLPQGQAALPAPAPPIYNRPPKLPPSLPNSALLSAHTVPPQAQASAPATSDLFPCSSFFPSSNNKLPSDFSPFPPPPSLPTQTETMDPLTPITTYLSVQRDGVWLPLPPLLEAVTSVGA